jgi:hypothetical protein
MYLRRPPTQKQLNKIIALLSEIPTFEIERLKKEYGIDFGYLPTYDYAERIIAILENIRKKYNSRYSRNEY